MSIQVGILLFDEVDILDFAGPFEVLTCASRMHARDYPSQAPLFKVWTVAAKRNQVKARTGTRIQPDHAFDAHPSLECLIIPGGIVDAELQKPEVVAWVRQAGNRARIAASIGAGAYLLAQARLVRGQRITTHSEEVEVLRRAFPQLKVQSGVRWMDSGNVVTAAGSSAGIDMSLHLVDRLQSTELAHLTARHLDFRWAAKSE